MEQALPAFRLFACCVLVKGAARAALFDLERERIRYLPLPLAELLTLLDGEVVEVAKSHYDAENAQLVDEFVRVLLEEEWGFLTTEPDVFPPMPTDWDTPGAITQALLDWDKNSSYDLPALVGELDELGCRALQLRVMAGSSPNLDAFLAAFKGRGVQSVELLLPAAQYDAPERLLAWLSEEARITGIWLYGADRNAYQDLKPYSLGNFIRYVTQPLTPDTPETDSPAFFSINLPAYTEALHFHPGLNRKIAVDARGLIRHFPGHGEQFGRAGEQRLRSVIDREDFRAIWRVNKDQVAVCRDCEFRYVCPDNTELISTETGYRRKRPCSYDPYTTQWQPSTESAST